MPIVRLQAPGFKEKNKKFYECYCCAWNSDPMHIVVRVPVTGYTPGQTINVAVEVDNKSEIKAEFNVQLTRVRFIIGN